MAIRTAATASAVVRPAISISRRTRANKRGLLRGRFGCNVSVMQTLQERALLWNRTQRKARGCSSPSPATRDRAGSTACLRFDAPDLSRSRLKALILEGQVDGRKRRDPRPRLSCRRRGYDHNRRAASDPGRTRGRRYRAQYRLRGRRHHRHRQAEGTGGASRRRP